MTALCQDAWRVATSFLTPVELFQFGHTCRHFHRLSRPWLARLVRERVQAVLARRGLMLPTPWPPELRLSGSAVYHALTADAGTDWQPRGLDFYLDAPELKARLVDPQDNPLLVEFFRDNPPSLEHCQLLARVGAWLQAAGLRLLNARVGESYNEYAQLRLFGVWHFLPVAEHAAFVRQSANAVDLHHFTWGDTLAPWMWPPEPNSSPCLVVRKLPRTLPTWSLVWTHSAACPTFDLPVLENFFDGRRLVVRDPEALVRRECAYRWPSANTVRGQVESHNHFMGYVRYHQARVNKYLERGLAIPNSLPPLAWDEVGVDMTNYPSLAKHRREQLQEQTQRAHKRARVAH